MTAPIRHIIFDLGNVLVALDWETAFGRLMPHLPPDMAALLRTDRTAFLGLLHEPGVALETGHIDFREFYRQASALLVISMSFEEFRFVWCDLFRLNTEMVALGEGLSTRYQTWLASNTSRAHFEWIIGRFPRVAFYEGAALSFELGVMKPAREYYEKALTLFGIQDEPAIFIDDLEENVAAARDCGMIGIVFRGKDRLVEELANLGVTVAVPTE
jgi:glucose-1-phosphatase